MKPILTPTAAEVLRCVRETMDSGIIPSLTGQTERSNAATIQHMLRFVEYRIDREGQVLFDEIARLRELLATALPWLEGRAEAAALRTAIADILATTRDPAIYPALGLLGDEVALLRQQVCDLLILLHAAPPADAVSADLHGQVRHYIVWQLKQEGTIVEPAFVDQGPRR